MHRAVLLPLLALLGCDPAPCTTEACTEACNRQNISLMPTEGAGALQVLTAWEAKALEAEITDLRAGVRTRHGDVALCVGPVGRCERPLPLDAGILPPGPHHLRAQGQAPRRARPQDIPVQLLEQCVDFTLLEGGPPSETKDLRAEARELVLEDGGRFTVEGWPVHEAPPRSRSLCAWKVVFEGPQDATHTVEGRYEVRAPDWVDPGTTTTPTHGEPAPSDTDAGDTDPQPSAEDAVPATP